jgi:membrane dipeptidase
MAEWGLSEETAKFHAAAIVCDNIFPFFDFYAFTNTMNGEQASRFDLKYEALDRYRVAGATFVGLTIGGSRPSMALQVRGIAHLKGFLAATADKYVMARTADDIVRAKREGKMAVGFNFQGCDCLEGMVDMVEVYYELGVRQMLLTYNVRNSAGTGCHDPKDDGLSQYGRAIVREMNRVGMIVDASHTGFRTTMDIFETSSAPVVFSHSNPAGLQAHPRNINDEQISACAASGGVIGVVGFDGFLPGRKAAVEGVLQAIDYLVEKAGIDHVGLGLDWIYCEPMFHRALEVNKVAYPSGEGGDYDTPAEFLGPEVLPRITEGLLARGYGASDVRKVLGENWLRVQRQVIKA